MRLRSREKYEEIYSFNLIRYVVRKSSDACVLGLRPFCILFHTYIVTVLWLKAQILTRLLEICIAAKARSRTFFHNISIYLKAETIAVEGVRDL